MKAHQFCITLRVTPSDRLKLPRSHFGLSLRLSDQFAGLYQVEEEICGQLPLLRRRHRQKRSGRQAEVLRVAIDDALCRPSPGSVMAKALADGWSCHVLSRFLGETRPRLITTSPNARCARLPSGERTGRSPAQRPAASVLPRSTRSSGLRSGIELKAYITDVI